MDLYIECPVCEQQFSTPAGPPEQKVACPNCSRKFSLSSAAEVLPPSENAGATPSFKTRLQVPATFESPIPDSIEEDIPITLAPLTPTSPKPVVKKPILALQRKRRSRRRLITTLVSSAILATMIGVLTGLLVKQLKLNPITSNETFATILADHDTKNGSADSDTDASLSPDGKPELKEPSQPEVEEVETRIRPEDIPPQTFTYLNGKASKERWNAVQPHLVSLKVFDGLGTHDAVGTIVDSRGWILTSYNTVKGASKIEVKASVNSIDDYWEAEPLVDLVRGYIAEQKEDDLVLLSINRRFIVAFSIVQPATKNNVVANEYLLQCSPPSRDNLYGGTEIKIAKRANLGSLDPVGRSLAVGKQLNGEDLVWLVATGQTAPLPGAPLFKIDGEMAAINVFSARNQNYFLPVDKVKDLIAGADPKVKPLRDLGIASGDSGPVAVSASSQMHEPNVRLNRLAESCKIFDWIPQTREDYDVLQEFAEAYCVIEKYAADHAGSTGVEEKKIVAQKNQLHNLIRRRAASLSIEDELQLIQMNKKFASKELQEPNRNVPFYGEVHFVDIVNAQLILRLCGTESYAKAPFVPTDNPMRMQTKWIFFGQTPATSRRVNYRISKTELITAEAIDDFLNFGEQ